MFQADQGSMDVASVASRASLAASSIFSVLTGRTTLATVKSTEKGAPVPEGTVSNVTSVDDNATTTKSSVGGIFSLAAWSNSKGSSNPSSGTGSLPKIEEKVGRYPRQHTPLEQDNASIKSKPAAGKSEIASNAKQILQAYRIFCTVDVEVAGRLEGRNMIRLLTDAETPPKDEEVLCFSVIVPELDCGIQFKEHVDKEGNCHLTIDGIEEQSPAMYISQLVKGLRLVDVQGIPIHTVQDLTAAEKTISAANRKKGADNRRIVFRFQEPAYIVDRYSNAVELQVLVPNRRRQNKRQAEQGNASLSKLVPKEQRVLMQVEMPNGAYTTRQEFVNMLQERVRATASRLELPGRFDVRLEEGDVVLSATKCPFRILFKSGEWSQRSAHTLLGFENEDTREEKRHKGQRPRVAHVDLSRLTRVQIDQLAGAIMTRYDAGSAGSMSFEDFYTFFVEFLATPDHMLQLRHWIREQFLSEEEIAQRAAEAKEAIERERRRLEVEENRKKNRDIKNRQLECLKGKQIKDTDGRMRLLRTVKTRRGPPPKTKPPPPPILDVTLSQTGKQAGTKKIEEAEADDDDASDSEFDDLTQTLSPTLQLTRRQLAKSIKLEQQSRPTILVATLMNQATLRKTVKLQELAQKDKTILALAKEYGADLVAAEKPTLMHPAFYGFLNLRSRPFDSAVINPIFFNHRVVPVSKPSVTKLAAVRQMIADVVDGPERYHTNVWRYFPYPNINTMIIRQVLRSALPQLYDQGALTHPACYGHMIVTEHPLDSSCTHPSHFNFKLKHKPVTDPHSNRLLHMLFRDKILKAVCETCTLGKPGCPGCWELPVGFTAADFEFRGPETHSMAGRVADDGNGSGSSLAAPLPPIHTKLTTERALYWHRRLHCDYVTVVIKSLPYGGITLLTLEKGDPVSYLYHLFLSNSAYGDRDAALYIPHSRGCFSVDNTFLPASDLANEVDTGREPLTSYNLRSRTDRVLLLHVQTHSVEHSLGLMGEYVRLTLARPLPAAYRIIYELDDIPPRWDEDAIQRGLMFVVEEQLANMQQYKKLVEGNVRVAPASRKGTVTHGTAKMLRLTRLRMARKHEANKILALQQIVITEGDAKADALEARRTTTTATTHVSEKLKRQRYRKHRRQSFEAMQLEWNQKHAARHEGTQNLFLSMAATLRSNTVHGDHEVDFYSDLN